MKTSLLLAALLLSLSNAALAATVSGTVVGGGNVDDAGLTIRTADGKEVTAYCVKRCGDWFDMDENGVRLKASHMGRRGTLSYATEANRGRIAGPGDDEMLNFVKKFEFAR